MRKSTLIGMIVCAGLGGVIAALLYYAIYLVHMTFALNYTIESVSPPCGGDTIKFFCRDIIDTMLVFRLEGIKYGALVGVLIGEIVGMMRQMKRYRF